MKTPKEWLSDNGYGTGTNFTFNSVAGLIDMYVKELQELEPLGLRADIKTWIIENRYNVTDQAGNELMVIDADDLLTIEEQTELPESEPTTPPAPEDVLEKHCGKVSEVYRRDAYKAMREYALLYHEAKSEIDFDGLKQRCKDIYGLDYNLAMFHYIKSEIEKQTK